MIFEEKTLASERVYEGRILNLRRDKVTVRTGTSTREIVEHNGGAAAAAFTAADRIVLVRQYRKTLERAVLEVPAGKIERGEDPQQAVRRELKEETGYTAAEIVPLTAMAPSVGYTTEIDYLYLATGLTPGATDLDLNEAIDVVEMDFEEVVGMIERGEICDAKTIAAVLLAARRRARH
ncbi:MAG: NUDIX hydrolase [Anaerovoracaceae bacterium]|jgi:ADP-ribose pyrophosphatase